MRVMVLAVLALTACTQASDEAGDGETTVEAAQEVQYALVVDGDGFAAVHPETGSTRWIKFGQPAEGVADQMSELLDAEYTMSGNEECPAGPMEFADFGDFSLNFQDGKFVGWSVTAGDGVARKIGTMDGVGPGVTREKAASGRAIEPLEGSTLEHEFNSGDLSMIFSGAGPDAVIENMWAGTNCIFR